MFQRWNNASEFEKCNYEESYFGPLHWQICRSFLKEQNPIELCFSYQTRKKCLFGGRLARKGNAASSCSIGHDATSAAENAFHATAARQIHFVLFQGCTLDFRVFLFQTFIRIMQKIEDPIRIPEYVPTLTNPRYSSILHR